MPGGLSASNSIVINGVYFIVVPFTAQFFTTDVIPETLRHSNLGMFRVKSQVNLEHAFPVNGRPDGYFVSGHIDSIGGLLGIHCKGNALLFSIHVVPVTLQDIVEKGPVAIDDINLAVVSIDKGQPSVSMIPHTTAVITFAVKCPDNKLNLRTGLLGRYVLCTLLLVGENGTDKKG